MSSLKELQKELVEYQKLAMQGSYQRRAPAKKAILYLFNARKGFKTYVESKFSLELIIIRRRISVKL
ncbi:hypothetical protein [Thermaerobacillus caldiproteolyticus]|uniref:hypothetical protein n=1 Tax=Thermaerobacillus caldiproteolyticus TaxID=247480 RepID=UPI001E39B66B|nr:hypothetical protein [Anoxybacillus caldiproteolyticus]